MTIIFKVLRELLSRLFKMKYSDSKTFILKIILVFFLQAIHLNPSQLTLNRQISIQLFFYLSILADQIEYFTCTSLSTTDEINIIFLQ